MTESFKVVKYHDIKKDRSVKRLTIIYIHIICPRVFLIFLSI